MAYTRHPNLVLGFAVFSGFTRLDGTRMFHHMAVYPDDRMFITADTFPMSEAHFDKIGRHWNALEGSTVQEVLDHPLSADVHFLGNYPFLFQHPAK